MICYINEIQGLLSTLTKKVLFFKDFKALKNQWWILSTFKHFNDLYEPCNQHLSEVDYGKKKKELILKK